MIDMYGCTLSFRGILKHKLYREWANYIRRSRVFTGVFQYQTLGAHWSFLVYSESRLAVKTEAYLSRAMAVIE